MSTRVASVLHWLVDMNIHPTVLLMHNTHRRLWERSLIANGLHTMIVGICGNDHLIANALRMHNSRSGDRSYKIASTGGAP